MYFISLLPFRAKEYNSLEQSLPLDITTRNISRHYEGLHVIIPTSSDKMKQDQKLEEFVKFYSERTRASREHWLVDMTHAGNIELAVDEFLKDMPLDLDDDLFLFQQIGKMTVINEFYEIHSSRPRKLLHYGTWSDEFGLEILNDQKWTRRQNLEVSPYAAGFVYVSIYVSMKYIIFRESRLESCQDLQATTPE